MSRVTIIIPVYNAAGYLAETIDSVLSQTYADWECILMDDGSNDRSAEICQAYCSQDIRFRYKFQANAGPSAARNNALGLASGDFVQFLDADDVMLPNRLEKLIDLYKTRGDREIVYSNYLLGDENNIYVTSQPNRPAGLVDQPLKTFREMYGAFGNDFLFVPACVLFPVKSLEGVKWNEQMKHSEDWDLYLQITARQWAFYYITEPLAIYRNVNNSLSKQYINTTRANYKILVEWGRKGDHFLLIRRISKILSNNINKYLLRKEKSIVLPELPGGMFYSLFLIIGVALNIIVIEFSVLIISIRKRMP